MKACPDSPNCVSSEAADEQHRIEAFKLLMKADVAWPLIVETIQNTARTRIVKDQADHIHAEYKSLVFRFIDDLDLHLEDDATIISVRSASRSGYYDFGVNRKRVEELRRALQKQAIIE